MRRICFITNKYPNIAEPSILVFLQQLVWSMADMGVECTVIAPMPTNIYPRYKRQPYHTVEETEKGNKIDIFWPKYTGFGDSHRILGWSPARLTTSLFTSVVYRTIKKEKIKIDAVYAHFLEPAGVAAARIGKKINKPSFVAYGEATFNSIDYYGERQLRKELSVLSGVIAVSTQNKEMLLSKNLVDESKISVFPNGYRPERFYPRDKKESRERFGLPHDRFIVGFVGSFDNRKGANRLSEAIDLVDGAYAIFAGKGSVPPITDKALWKDQVNNIDLPWFYSAADAFVLPTLNEGCCNAIIEALACGLPIISSNRSFNDDILNSNCSIRINSDSVDEIAQAINRLKSDNTLLCNLKKGSLEQSKKLTLETRTRNIYEFISTKAIW